MFPASQVAYQVQNTTAPLELLDTNLLEGSNPIESRLAGAVYGSSINLNSKRRSES
jgi:hypothetical protein